MHSGRRTGNVAPLARAMAVCTAARFRSGVIPHLVGHRQFTTNFRWKSVVTLQSRSTGRKAGHRAAALWPPKQTCV